MATHAEAKIRFIAQEKLMVIGSHLRASGHSSETPSIQFSSEAGKLCSLEVLWEHRLGKLLFLVDDEAASMRKPRNRVGFISVG